MQINGKKRAMLSSVEDWTKFTSEARSFPYAQNGGVNSYCRLFLILQINQWMTDMASKFPNLVTLFNISQSYEGRNITAMKVRRDGVDESRMCAIA